MILVLFAESVNNISSDFRFGLPRPVQYTFILRLFILKAAVLTRRTAAAQADGFEDQEFRVVRAPQ